MGSNSSALKNNREQRKKRELDHDAAYKEIKLDSYQAISSEPRRATLRKRPGMRMGWRGAGRRRDPPAGGGAAGGWIWHSSRKKKALFWQHYALENGGCETLNLASKDSIVVVFTLALEEEDLHHHEIFFQCRRRQWLGPLVSLLFPRRSKDSGFGTQYKKVSLSSLFFPFLRYITISPMPSLSPSSSSSSSFPVKLQ